VNLPVAELVVAGTSLAPSNEHEYSTVCAAIGVGVGARLASKAAAIPASKVAAIPANQRVVVDIPFTS
jgi:hypothetical protein